MMGELSCARKFDSRIERKAWLAAAGVICIIRCLYFIAKTSRNVVAKVTSICKGVTFFAVRQILLWIAQNIGPHFS